MDHEYFSALQDELGFQTVWQIPGYENLHSQMFEEKPHRVTYEFWDEEIDAWTEESTMTRGGRVLDFWRAAEDCYDMAYYAADQNFKNCYIKAFDRTDNGFDLILGRRHEDDE